jgi:hypothetical protein
MSFSERFEKGDAHLELSAQDVSDLEFQKLKIAVRKLGWQVRQ